MDKPTRSWRDSTVAFALFAIIVSLVIGVVALPDSHPQSLTSAALVLLMLAIVLTLLRELIVNHPEGWATFKADLLSGWAILKTLRLRWPWTFGEDSEAKQLRATLLQHWSVTEYGNLILKGLEPLTPFELEFLNKEMRKLRPIVDNAATAVRALFSRLVGEMKATPVTDPRFWLGDSINDRYSRRLERVLTRFRKQVEQGIDSREALAAFHLYYLLEAPLWINRMQTFLKTPADTYDEFRAWQVSVDQYWEALEQSLERPQFGAVKSWLLSNRPRDPWAAT